MNDRPPIPADIRRKILIEAGHRCAIQTCLHPSVDLHHIIPLEKCKSHTVDNLIALCQNCHARAGRGEIDKKSLFLYKARLQSIIKGGVWSGDNISTEMNSLDVSQKLQYSIIKIAETRDEAPMYDVEIEYPIFSELNDNFKHINSLIQALMIEELAEMRMSALMDISDLDRDSIFLSMASQIAISFDITFSSQFITSIKFNVFHYGAGAAHPNHWTKVMNYVMNPLTLINIHVLFKDNSNYMKVISDYCIEELCKQLNIDDINSLEYKSVTEGAGPKIDNYKLFNVTPQGITVTFEEYQVGPYSMGQQNVSIPYDNILDILNPNISLYIDMK